MTSLGHMLSLKYRWSGFVYAYGANCLYKVVSYTYKPVKPFQNPEFERVYINVNYQPKGA